MFRAYFFDLDGTLINSIPSIVASMRFTYLKHLGKDLPDDVLKSGIGTPLLKQLKEHSAMILGCSVENVDENLAQAMAETYLENNRESHLAGNVWPFDGVREMLAELKNRGALIGLVTSKGRDSVELDLKLTGLDSFFDCMICGGDAKEAKPSGAPVQAALDALNLSCEDAIYVGDAICDMQSGHAAGTKTGGALWGPFGRALEVAHPDFWLEKPTDLLEI